MTLSNKTLLAACKLSNRACRKDGYGNQVCVWGEGDVTEAVGPNDQVARLRSDGTRSYPLLRLCYPTPRAKIAEMLLERMKCDAYRARQAGL